MVTMWGKLSMFAKFINLNPDKQQRILEAAIDEFANQGFDKASTNEIVKQAGISKGLLFHYFKNKKNLYLFLYDYCIEQGLNQFYGKINLEERDIVLRLRQILAIKLELLSKFSKIFVFLEVAQLEKSADVKAELELKNNKLLLDTNSKILKNIDTSKFREDIDITRTINIMMWTFEGFAAQAHKIEQQKGELLSLNKEDCETAFAEADKYIDIFKKSFYK